MSSAFVSTNLCLSEPGTGIRTSMHTLSFFDARCTSRRRRWLGYAAVFAALVAVPLCPAASLALTPESPEVKAVVARAIKGLEAIPNTDGWDQHPGARALVGMCMLKHYPKETAKTHPKVAAAVESIRAALNGGSVIPDPQIVYNIGLCEIFLLELDQDGTGSYRPLMEQLLAKLLAAQKPHGGFGYPHSTTGDTSMHQYGCLGMWACMMAGISVPIDNWERAANWVLRTQDPKGGFGYQGDDPGAFTLIPQTEVRHSLSAAGLGSLGICSSSMRLFMVDDTQSSGPPQLKRIVKNESLSKNVDPKMVRETFARGAGWFAANYTSDYKMEPRYAQFTYYYMYAMERYKSFLQEIDPKQKDNKWYDDGYASLAKKQADDGTWRDGGYHVPDTCFAILFLTRSTQKAITHAKTFGGGLLVGGRGLPENASDVELAGGSVRAKALKGPAMELLQKLAPDNPEFEATLRGIEEQSLVDASDNMTEIEKRLRGMAEGKSPAERAAALKLMGRLHDLDNVPILIESLKDPDPLVFDAALTALRFIARKFNPSTSGGDQDARKQAIEQWKAWYRNIRPDAKFADD